MRHEHSFLSAVLGMAAPVLLAAAFPAAAVAADYLSPEESLQRMELPDGFRANLFAHEPDIVKVIAMAWDERGRLYVLECMEYPNGAKPGTKPRDRIKILEDTDGDGVADKVTLFADGIDLATGMQVGYGGVFVGAAPYLYFLKDSDGDGVADSREVLLEGFGKQDTHEMLNSFVWGPDGWLYGCHGVFTYSKVQGIPFSAAIWRYHPLTKKFEIFAEGTSNPWGVDFNAVGSSFLEACVIPHLFHMVPGGLYIRQAGQNANPYAYGQIREISDHVHYYGVTPHAGNNDPRSSATGGGHAHAGLLCYLGDNFPAEYRGSLFMGNIHGNRVNRDVLVRNGSTYIGKHAPDFLKANDRNFRALNTQLGPDGSLYQLDWHEGFPCHNTNEAAWTKDHGRIYRITYTGGKPLEPRTPQARDAKRGGDMSKLSSAELVRFLTFPNAWQGRMANRILAERQDRSVVPALEKMALESDTDEHALAALWALYSVGGFDEAFARQTLGSRFGWVRAWTVRFLGEAETVSGGMLKRLLELAQKDPSPDVRLQLAATCQRLKDANVAPLLEALALRGEDGSDPQIPLMIWIAYEPRVAAAPGHALDWLGEHAGDNSLVARDLVPRIMRRLVATGDPELLAACVRFAGAAARSEVRRPALDGLIAGLAGRHVAAPPTWQEAFAQLRDDPDRGVQLTARRLAAHFGDAAAIRLAESDAQSAELPLAERITAVQTLALGQQPASVAPLIGLLRGDVVPELRAQVIRALAAFDSPDVSRTLLGEWENLSPALRVDALGLLAGRRPWALDLLAAVAAGPVARTELNANVILRMHGLKDAAVNESIERIYGKVRDETPQELAQLIERMQHVLEQGRGDPERGQLVFEKNCIQCHKFYGKGHDVGPDLTGSNREVGYLLINILDPNRVVGQGYYANVIALDSGQVLTGIVVAEDNQSITLKRENNVTDVIPKSKIEERQVQNQSIMPVGLANNMTPDEFRDLIQYLTANPFLNRVALAGPFESSDVLEKPFAPENAQHPLAAAGVRWIAPAISPYGRIDLTALAVNHPRAGSAAYVVAEVSSPEAYETDLLFGSDDGLKIWLNGRVMYRGHFGGREASPDQQTVRVRLEKGTNRLLFKVANDGGNSVLYARLADPERKLVQETPHSTTRAASK